ncbi:GPI mannosyltransferase 4-like [Littorina saxatilis]|uniref:Mannosyltransferase n=1 Tax=Littorina saxatilis TaxID=31220 RepID=A0AAN9ANQ9_9CAEN
MAVLWVLVAVMGVTVLWPQPGYIHPDEFFQSTEVLAGDIFNITHLRTWEFNREMPLRDVSLSYLLFAPAFYALRAALNTPQMSGFISESYAVLILPRMLLALAGFVNYCLVKKLCTFFAVDDRVAVWYWLTSYVTWVFLVRSFSNTTETLLFSAVCILLLDLVQCCTRMRSVRVTAEPTPAEEAAVKQEYRRFRKCSFVLGVMLCMGIFNRPTFGVFTLAPLVWWVDQLNSARLKATFQFMTVFLTAMGFLLAFCVMSVSSSLYYNQDFSHLLSDLHVAISQCDTALIQHTLRAVLSGFRIPPLNFMRYNLQASNLAEHGLHPWYTHFLVNFPMLLGPLVLLFLWNLATLFRRCLTKHPNDVLYAIVTIPIISLSFFPHQEARFLLPVVPVAVVCVAGNSIAKWKTFKAVTLLCNILAFVLFGWLHQGGVVPAMSALQSRFKVISSDPVNHGSHYHIVSYATYMPPRHLLFSDESKIKLHVHDMIGAHNSPPTLKLRMEELKASCNADKINCHFFMLLPATALLDVTSITGWQEIDEGQFCPHVSMERLPSNFSVETKEDVYCLLRQFCLKIVSVKM